MNGLDCEKGSSISGYVKKMQESAKIFGNKNMAGLKQFTRGNFPDEVLNF